MNAGQRFKLSAGAGLVTMLLGALMVLAPGAGANHGEDHASTGGNEDCPAGTTEVAKFEWNGSMYVEELEEGESAGPVSIADGATAQGGSWTSTEAISVVVVKGGTDAKIVDVTGDGTSGTFDGTGLVNAGGNQPAISNVKFCAGVPTGPRTGSVTVVKDVTGTVPTTWSFDFLAGTDTVTLSGTDVVQSDSELRDGLAGGSAFTVSEKAEQTQTGYVYDGYRCVRDVNDTVIDQGDGTDRQADVQVLAGENITCTFTNDFPAEPETSLTLQKQVRGASSWAIDLSCAAMTEDEVQAAAIGTPNVKRVDNNAPSFECATEPGTYAISENLDTETPSNMSFVSVLCELANGDDVDAPLVDGVRSVAVAEGQDVTCTFLNEVPTQTVVPSQPVVLPEPEVVPASLTVVKEVAGLASAIPATWNETIDIDSVGAANPVSNVTVDQDDLSEVQGSLVAGTYRLDEVGADSDRMELTDIECTEGNPAVVSSSTLVDADDLRDGIEVTLAQGSDMTCVFTNTYTAAQVLPEDEEPGSITVVKAIDGWAPAAGWSFGYDGSGGIGRFTLTDTDATTTFGSLEAGTYTLVEDANSETSLMSIRCDGEDLVTEGRSVTVDLAEDEDVTCVFTNAFNPAPAVVPAPEVKGVQTIRALPRTGDETGNLAAVGGLLVALGAAMLLGSKRRLARS